MTTADTCILIVSCDKYSDLWAPFDACLAKFWPDCPFPVYLGSNERRFDSPRIQGLAVGPDAGYGANLKKMLQALPQRWVIFWVEDRLISAPVNTKSVLSLVAEAQQRGAEYLKLIPEHPLAYSAHGPTLGAVPVGTPYRVSLTVGLWRKDCLMEIAKPEENAWQIERNGTVRSNSRPGPYLALSPAWRSRPPIPHAHVIVKGRLIRASLRFLQREGLIDALASRQVEPLSSVIYATLYHAFFGILRPLHHRWLGRAVR